MMHDRNTVIKLLFLGLIAALLLLLPAVIVDAANDVASVGTSNSTTTQLTPIWTEYNNISIVTGSGNTSIYLSAVVSTNSTQAKLYGRIKRDGTVIESIAFSQSVYPETATFVVPVVETEATHIYTFEAYCTSGRLCTISNRTFSAIFIKSGSFGSSAISALQINDTYFNGTVYPNSTNFRNNSALQTSTYSGNFPNSTLASKEATWDAKEPAISQGVSPQFWMFNKTWQNITTSWITEGVNLWFTDIRAITAVQSILNAMNQSSANNNTASQGRDNAINSTKLNKTDILPNASIPLSAANLSANNTFTGATNTFVNSIIVSGVNVTEAPCSYGFGGDYSYLICTDGTTIYAKNGSTGKVDYSGTNSDDVLDSTINGMSGGVLKIQSGEYVWRYGSIINNIIIEGEGNSTIIYAPIGSYSFQFYLGSNSVMRNLQINGRDKVVSIIYVYNNVNNSILENFLIENIFFNGTGDVVSVNGGDNSNAIIRSGIIQNNFARNITQFGSVEGNVVSDYSGTRDITFYNNIVYNNTGTEFFDFNHATNIKLINNIFWNEGTDDEIEDEAIDMNGDNPGSIVSGNIIRGCFSMGIRAPKYNAIIDKNTIEFIPCADRTTGDSIALWNGGLSLNHNPRHTIVSNNNINGTGTGILLGGASYNTINANVITNTTVGIKVYTDTYNGANMSSQNNTFIGNIIINSQAFGIVENGTGTDYNIFIGNSVNTSTGVGVQIEGIHSTDFPNNIDLKKTIVNDNGLSLDMRFNENSTGTASNIIIYDHSKYVYDGLWSGHTQPNWTKGVFGTALLFDGVDDYVNIIGDDSNASMNLLNNGTFSITAWMKINNLTTYNYIIGDQSNENSHPAFYVDADNDVICSIFWGSRGTTANALIVQATDKITDTDWHSYGCSVSNSTSGITVGLYVDGTLVKSGSTVNTFSNNTRAIDIGRGEKANVNYYSNATIDEVRIYKSTLSAEDIKTLYNSNPLSEKSSLVQTDNFRFLNNSGYKIANINNTGYFGNIILPTCRPSNPINGMLCINSTDNIVDVYSGGAWRYSGNGTIK